MIMEAMKYSLSETVQHFNNINTLYDIDISDCILPICDLYSNEGGEINFNNTENIINLDCIEHFLIRKQNRIGNNTMDFTFIIKNSLKELVLADFKLNTSPESRLQSINKSKIEKKILNSIESYSLNITIHPDKYLIFRKEIVPIAKSRINRQYYNRKHQIKSTDIKEFYNIFFS